MGDARSPICGWCGGPLPAGHRTGTRYCRPAHRQAGYRQRRAVAVRLHTTFNPQVAMAFVIEDIKARREALDGLLADVSAGPDDDRRLAAPGASPHTAHRPGP